MSENNQATAENQAAVNVTPELQQRVNKVIAEQLGIENSEGMEHKAFVADLGADSLDSVEMVMAIEDEFEIEIPDEDADNFRTGSDVAAYLAQHKPELLK